MAYKRHNLLKLALKAISENKLIFISEVVAFLPCGKSAFYQIFSKDLPDREEIEMALIENRIRIKSSLRAKWYISDNPQLQIALMKLLGTEEELRRLSMAKIDSKAEVRVNLEPITGMIIY